MGTLIPSVFHKKEIFFTAESESLQVYKRVILRDFPHNELLVKKPRMKNGEEYPRNEKHTCKGTGVDHGAYEKLKNSPCGRSRGIQSMWQGQG